MPKSLLYLGICLTIGLFSCSPPPPPSLNKEQKKIVDSLYRQNLDSVKKEIQLLCEEQHTSIYQHAIDSIQELRKEEFQSILDQ